MLLLTVTVTVTTVILTPNTVMFVRESVTILFFTNDVIVLDPIVEFEIIELHEAVIGRTHRAAALEVAA